MSRPLELRPISDKAGDPAGADGSRHPDGGGLSSFLREVGDSYCGVEASGEADSERVECLLPSLGSGAEFSSSVVSNVSDGQVEDLEHGVAGGGNVLGFW